MIMFSYNLYKVTEGMLGTCNFSLGAKLGLNPIPHIRKVPFAEGILISGIHTSLIMDIFQ
jgi:hypothetical protein